MDWERENTRYKSLTPRERLESIFSRYDPGKILVTSSFGSTSVALLHMISQVKPGHPIHFVDTTYHFEETEQYKDLLAKQLNLNVVALKAPVNRNKFTKENYTYLYNQDLCCFINKVDPVEQIKGNYDIWISGLLAFQNANRRKMGIFESKDDVVKFHPIIDMTREELALYIQLYDLQVHPLIEQGYDSIGCMHCTVKGTGRTGRWINSAKNECGLHV